METVTLPLNRRGYEQAIAWLITNGRTAEFNASIDLETDGFSIINLVNHLRNKTPITEKVEVE